MYQPSPELKKLEAEKAKAEQQLAREQHKYQRLCNREQYYKKRERTARAHRLITRGAAVESVSPLVKVFRFSRRSFGGALVERLTLSVALSCSAEQKGYPH